MPKVKWIITYRKRFGRKEYMAIIYRDITLQEAIAQFEEMYPFAVITSIV